MIMLTDAIWFSEPRSATDRPVLAIIKGSERSLMIDGGNCPNHATTFPDELSRRGFAEPDFVATTHSHCDHIFGLSALKGIVLSNSVTSDRIGLLNRLGWNDGAEFYIDSHELQPITRTQLESRYAEMKTGKP
jgi:glyoxylase-like metal-dependent hydrolase (beta-lactamase superfamily II)